MRIFLYIMMFLGSVVPIFFFAQYFIQTSFSIENIFGSLFHNPLMSGFTLDILLSIFLFLVWTFVEYKDDLKRWYLLLITSCLVGLSFSLPIYLLMKYKKE